MHANFLLGTLKITKPARLVLKRIPLDLIARHAVNDYGDITPEERTANDDAMETLGLIRSRFKADPTNPRSKNVLVETCATWSDTTVSIE